MPTVQPVVGSAWTAAAADTATAASAMAAKQAELARVMKHSQQLMAELKATKEQHTRCLEIMRQIAEDLEVDFVPDQLREEVAKILKGLQECKAMSSKAHGAKADLDHVLRMAEGSLAGVYFRDLLAELGVLEYVKKDDLFKWAPGARERAQKEDEEEEAAGEERVRKGEKNLATEGITLSEAKAKLQNKPWNEDLRQIAVVKDPGMIKMVKAQLVAGECFSLEDWAENYKEWAKKPTFNDEKLFAGLRSKMISTLVHGTPHSVGIMCHYFVSAGRVAATLAHYPAFQNIDLMDVVGCAMWSSEAEAVAVNLGDVTLLTEDQGKMAICLKFKGNHGFAEDGGRLPAGKAGGKEKKWNQWRAADSSRSSKA